MKRMKARFRRALEGKKEQDRLKCWLKSLWLTKSLDGGAPCQIWENFEKFLVFLKIWNSRHRKFVQNRSTTGAEIFIGASIGNKIENFGFRIMRTCTLEFFKSFGVDLVHQKVHKLPKNGLLPLFGHTEVVFEDSRFDGANYLQIQKI